MEVELISGFEEEALWFENQVEKNLETSVRNMKFKGHSDCRLKVAADKK